MSTRQTPAAFIEDGYSLPFSIPEVPGISMALSGTYRPMLRKDVTRLIEGLDLEKYKPKSPAAGMVNPPKPKPGTPDAIDKMDEFQSKLIADHIISWDLENAAGEVVAVSPANLSKIHPPSLQAELINVISGFGNKSIESRAVAIIRDTRLTNDEKVQQFSDLLENPELVDQTETEEATDEKN